MNNNPPILVPEWMLLNQTVLFKGIRNAREKRKMLWIKEKSKWKN